MIQAAFFGHEPLVDRVFGQGRRQQLEHLAQFVPEVGSLCLLREQPSLFAQVEVIFSTWGMPELSAEDLDLLPELKAVYYAAGSVQHFARPMLARGITVVSGWAANAVPVAEFTLAQILLANKGYFANARRFTNHASGRQDELGRGNYGAAVSLLGAGQIGRHLIGLLAPFQLKVQVYDPYLSAEAAAQMGVKLVSLEEAFATASVVSNHIANLPATRGLLHGGHFDSMPHQGTFINTGRGATVRESELIDVLKRRPDITALLDVTDPEPPTDGSPFYRLPNVFLSTHIAGSIADEVLRMADYMIEEFKNATAGFPLRYGVTLEMLETMA